VTTNTPLGKPLRPSGKLLQEDTRRHHRSLLLQQLFRHGPASRADLARSTALTRVTVSDLVGEMVDEGLVEALGVPVGSRIGKPPTLVGFVPDASHIVCLDLSRDDTMIGAVVSLGGEVRERRELAVESRRGNDALDLVLQLTDELVAAATRPVLGIGVGTPGVVDAAGNVIDAPNLGWQDVPLAEVLRTSTGLSVFVANDANAAALGEHTFGDATGGGLMVLRVGKGVGAGLILEGTLLHGHRSAAGEIGHVVVEPRGEKCACGRVGCLETLLAVPHLKQRLDGADDRTRVLTKAGQRLGAALAPVVGTLNLHELVLSGPLDLLDGPLIEAVAKTIRRNTMPVIGDELVVRTSALGEDVVLVGAAVLVLAGELGVS
jgi:predicted NBD/HSP70 family sugar kinase